MRAVILSMAIAGMVAGCGSTQLSAPSPAATQTLDLKFVPSDPVKEVVLDGLKSPWSIAFIAENDVLISEKGGDLVRADLTQRTRAIIAGFPSDLIEDRSANSGIFDVLLHPAFEKNQTIYVAYAAARDGAATTKIIRAELRGYELSNIETIFVAFPYTADEPYHYGGGMVFGADGRLYFTIGERLYSEADQPAQPIAQDLTDRRGKIYRVNDDGSIPADNPDFGPNAIPGLYATGIRASQGLAMNPTNGDIWFSEHGTHQGDELNILAPGANYGWPVKTTGAYRDRSYTPPAMSDTEFTPPHWYWTHTVAPTGLTFYNGQEFPEWQGDVLVPGLSRGSFIRMNLDGNVVVGTEEFFVNDRVRARKVAISPSGKLYLLTDTEFQMVPGEGFRNSGRPNGQLIRVRNRAVSVD